MEEGKGGKKSAIVNHAQDNNHHILLSDSKLITSISHWHTRRIREAMEMYLHHTVPQENGIPISNIWLYIINESTPITTACNTLRALDYDEQNVPTIR